MTTANPADATTNELQTPSQIPQTQAEDDDASQEVMSHESDSMKPSPPAMQNAISQITLMARNHVQYRALLEYLANLGIHPQSTVSRLHSISVTLDQTTLNKLKHDFNDIIAENNMILWIPEDPVAQITGKNGPSFGTKLLEWLGIDPSKPNRGKGVTIAILDHPISPKLVNPQANIKQIDLFGYAKEAIETGNSSSHGHGNAVASILVANNNKINGIAPSSQLLSIPVFGSEGMAYSFDVAKGIIAAVDNGAQIISLSLGNDSESSIIKSAVDYAHNAGVVIVASAGNDGTNQVHYPAASDNVIAVGAVAADSQIANFSNSGSEINLAAPGIGISTFWTEDYGIISFSGTSASAPCVAGVIANILSDSKGSMTPIEAASIVINNTIDNGAPGDDEIYGTGVLNYTRASNASKTGIIDAAAAGHFLDMKNATETSIPLIVSGQNTGTEKLATMTLTVAINGVEQSSTFFDVNPGEIVSSILPISINQFENNNSIHVLSIVSTPNANNRDNKTKISVISLSDE